MFDKSEEAIKNGQSRETDNILLTKHQTKKNSKKQTQGNMWWTLLCTNNIYKTWTLLQTTWGEGEPNIIGTCMLLFTIVNIKSFNR